MLEPVWDLYRDGVTQSLLSKWLICRHRFWLYAVCGLSVEEGFQFKLEYGNLFHEALEEYRFGERPIAAAQTAMSRYARVLRDLHPREGFNVNKWTRICVNQFDEYAKYWLPEDKNYNCVFTEQVFEQPYELPSGRVVKLRGKWDGAVTDKGHGSLYLWENKIKGEIDDKNLPPTLAQNIQVQFYLIPFYAYAAKHGLSSPEGVVYNLVRRPLSFGKHNISQKKGRKTNNGVVGTETESQFHLRLKQVIHDHPSDFFSRYKVPVSREQVDHFRKVSLDPLLEQLCDWWESIRDNPSEPWETNGKPNRLHYRRPFGVWDSMAMGLVGDFQKYLTTGDSSGMKRIGTVFPELGE